MATKAIFFFCFFGVPHVSFVYSLLILYFGFLYSKTYMRLYGRTLLYSEVI